MVAVYEVLQNCVEDDTCVAALMARRWTGLFEIKHFSLVDVQALLPHFVVEETYVAERDVFGFPDNIEVGRSTCSAATFCCGGYVCSGPNGRKAEVFV